MLVKLLSSSEDAFPELRVCLSHNAMPTRHADTDSEKKRHMNKRVTSVPKNQNITRTQTDLHTSNATSFGCVFVTWTLVAARSVRTGERAATRSSAAGEKYRGKASAATAIARTTPVSAAENPRPP